jgi:hypothetical protein
MSASDQISWQTIVGWVSDTWRTRNLSFEMGWWGFFDIVVLKALRDQGHGDFGFSLACLRFEVEVLPDPERAAGIIL